MVLHLWPCLNKSWMGGTEGGRAATYLLIGRAHQGPGDGGGGRVVGVVTMAVECGTVGNGDHRVRRMSCSLVPQSHRRLLLPC